jgi:hypothetical protein
MLSNIYGGEFVMTITDLEKKLDESLASFKSDVDSVVDDPYSKEPLTKGEALELIKQVFYCLNDYRVSIVEYLKQAK